MRWQEEEKTAGIRQWVNDPSPSIISLLLSPSTVSGDFKRETDKVTWSVSPLFFITDNTMLFATAANGFKSGGFNVGFGRLTADNREFQDENITHYEAGLKSTLMDGRMHLGGSVFMTEYDDYQDAAFVGAQFTVGNAEKVELTGFDVSLWVRNLTDETVVNFDAVQSLYAGDGSFQSFLQAPRSYGVTFRVAFF